MLCCELSGQVVVHPVITSCHHVFERELIEDYISNSHCCPKCNTPLDSQDLFDINITPLDTYPATIRATSFTSLLSSLQNEWDSVQDELFHLRKQLAETKRELAQALYENDAAKRVIARLLSEKGLAIPSHIINPIANDESKQQSNLATYFKKQARIISRDSKAKENQYAEESISIFNAFIQFSLTRQGPILNGESTLSAIDRYPQKQILIGAENGIVLGIDPLSGTSNQYASFDSGIVSLVSNPSFTQFIAADKNGNIKICAISSSDSGFSNSGSSNLALNEIRLSTQKPIISALFHPKGEHVIICYANGIIEVCVINESNPEHTSLDSVLTYETEMEFSMAELHSDGLYLITASSNSNKLYIFDVANKRLVSSDFDMPSEITAIALPRNNSRFVAAGCNSHVRVWDLKTSELVAEVSIGCTNLSFDSTGFILSIIAKNGSTCNFIRLNESGEIADQSPSIELFSSSRIGRFSTNANYFSIIGDHDCIDLISPQE